MSEAASLRERLAGLGRSLGAREAPHREALEQAQRHADRLHAHVAEALEAFEAASAQAGAPHLRIELSAPRLDDKHVRAVEFTLRRGRCVAIVTVKSRGEVTLVGPFRDGKSEGPCLTFAWDATDDLEAALAKFLEAFLEDAVTP